MRPYMCTPQSLHAWRWIAAFSSTTFNLSAFLVTLILSFDTTATTENIAPSGFQHLVQPQAWLCAVCESILTSTGLLVHLHCNVPPLKPSPAPFLIPPSMDG